MNMYDLPHSFSSERNVSAEGRLVSNGAGAVLIARGLRCLGAPSTGTFLELLAGTYLLYRGITAYCPLKGFLEKEYPIKPKS